MSNTASLTEEAFDTRIFSFLPASHACTMRNTGHFPPSSQAHCKGNFLQNPSFSLPPSSYPTQHSPFKKFYNNIVSLDPTPFKVLLHIARNLGRHPAPPYQSHYQSSNGGSHLSRLRPFLRGD
jgi:hypothetical protein